MPIKKEELSIMIKDDKKNDEVSKPAQEKAELIGSLDVSPIAANHDAKPP